MSLDIRDGFRDRTIFITGGTGFVGKVLLYKILKEFPDVRTIYLLMRGKKSRRFKKFLKPQERLELEVLGSPCFEGLRNTIGDAKWKALGAKVKAMDGDIVKDGLGLSAQDRARIVNEVHLIVHLAATVDFNARLDQAIRINTLGGLRMLMLAKTCTKLEAMVHVSTCYVNYALYGRGTPVEERIYPSEIDAEGLCKRILGLHPSEAEKQGKKLVEEFGFPNTYTLTKNIGERLLQKYRGDVPLAIVRPSIISCSLKDPYPGWVDALTAAGGIILTVSLGVVRELVCDGDLIADITPVDYVVNVILKALYKTALYHKAHPASAGAPHHAKCVEANESSMHSLRAIMSGGDKAASTTTNHTANEEDKKTASANKSVMSSWNAQLQNSVLAKLPGLKGEKKAVNNGLATRPEAAATTTSPSANAAAVAEGEAKHTQQEQQQQQQQQEQQEPTSQALTVTPARPLSLPPTTNSNNSNSVELPMIYQVCTTGSLNHVTWGRLADMMRSYMNNVKQHPKALGPCHVTLTSSNLYYLARYHILRYAPYMLLKQLAGLPEPIGSGARRKMVDKLGRAVRRADMLNNEFHDFVIHEWVYASTNTQALDEGLNEYSRNAFAFDPYAINWYMYTQLYIYGIFKYIVRDTGFLPAPIELPSPTEMFKRASSL